MKLRAIVDGQPFEFDLDAAAELIEVEPGVYSVIDSGRSYELRLDGESVWVDGRRLTVELVDRRRWNPKSAGLRGHGRENITSPMPGKVLRVLAQPGQEVTAGQGIVVIEAMKMQNELKAPRAGKIATIPVKENDTVVAGAVLATIVSD